jgi:predicted DNA binding CopG/RHH family protein
MPRFRTLEEAADFWDTHDFEDYVEDTKPVRIAVTIPRRKKTLKIPLALKVYEQIETVAAKRGVPAARLVSSWLKKKATEEMASL